MSRPRTGRGVGSREPAGRVLRRDRGVREMVRAWRSLTGGAGTRDAGRRTLVACSGGADSTALAIGLASASSGLVIGHVVHDLRARGLALRDRDAARALADRLGLPFAEASVSVRAEGGNAEGAARRERYAALAAMAREHRCPFVATAHHADDVAETMLMRLMRGAGVRGLAGVAPSRPLGASSRPGIMLVRPMLSLAREDSERVCRLAGVTWVHDETNDDASRLRAALRREVMPRLRALAPGFATRAARSARVLRDAAEVLGALAAALLAEATVEESEAAWDRARLRREHPGVVAETLRAGVLGLTGGRRADRISERNLRSAARAICGRGTEPKRVSLAGAEIDIRARRVAIRAVATPARPAARPRRRTS